MPGTTGAMATPFGFAGQSGYQSDADSGLMKLGYRYYDASTGRFLSRDPIRDGDNWYSYCKNDPVNAVDPRGLDVFDSAQALWRVITAVGSMIGVWNGSPADLPNVPDTLEKPGISAPQSPGITPTPPDTSGAAFRYKFTFPYRPGI